MASRAEQRRVMILMAEESSPVSVLKTSEDLRAIACWDEEGATLQVVQPADHDRRAAGLCRHSRFPSVVQVHGAGL